MYVYQQLLSENNTILHLIMFSIISATVFSEIRTGSHLNTLDFERLVAAGICTKNKAVFVL